MSRKVDCTILVEGQKVEDTISHIGLVQRMDGHHTFEFRLTLKDAQTATFTDAARKFLGKKVTLKVNFAPEKPDSNDLSFEGVAMEAGFGRSQGGTPELTVGGKSPTALLDDMRITRSFTDRSLDQIVQQLCTPLQSKAHGLKVKADYTAKLPYVVQYDESDLRFIARLAARFGEWFYYDGTALYFGKPDGGGSDESLTFGSNLFSFDIGLSVRRGNMELQHYAYAKNEILKATDGDAGTVAVDSTTYGTPAGQASKGMFKNGSVEYLGNAADRSEVKQRLRAQRVAVATDTVVLRGVSDNTRLGVGKYVKVSGPPDRDQGGTIDYGRFLIVGISHSSGHGNYQNQFEAIPADSDMVPSFAGSGTVLGEAQVAVVKEVDDPDKMGRVKVQFLWQRGTPELSPWIRVTSAHASGSSGQYHIPEVDEEVLVDFEFGDPEMPVVTGSLYHGKAKPDSAWATPKNEVKAYRTKSGNEIIISDKAGKESIQVRNKDGKNEVTLTLGAEPTIVLKTDGKLTLDASTIEIKCKTLDVKTTSGGIKSDTELKLEGSAMVTVKGGLIKLN